MPYRTLFLLALLFGLSSHCLAQTTATADHGFEGQLAVTTNFSGSYFVNFGSPHVGFKYNQWHVYVSAYPSLAMSATSIEPRLGIGWQAGYKHLLFAMPFYVIEGSVKPAFGLGWKF